MEKIRVGIFGVGRGMALAECFMLQNADIVAICDNHRGRRENALKRLGKDVAVYEDFDKFIEHPMDAVVLANNFYQHAPYAVKCFERNIRLRPFLRYRLYDKARRDKPLWLLLHCCNSQGRDRKEHHFLYE